MPICKREGFENIQTANKREENFHDNEDVFFCEVTKEIFRDYEDYFRHVMVINSTVWQCEATGRENLTYAEALKSERRARKKMDQFKDSLRAPVMLVIESAKQSSIRALNMLVMKFLKRRYFFKEQVTVTNKSSNQLYTVIDILPPEGKDPPGNGVYEDPEEIRYKLQRVDGNHETIIVPYENLRRNRVEFTVDSLNLFIKYNVTRVEGILRPKPESYKKYVTSQNITFSSIFIGKMPHYTPAKIKPQKQTDENAKKQSTMSKYLVKENEQKQKLTPEEIAKREKEKAEKAEARAKSLKEEMERIRREKQEKMLELERQKAEKKANLMKKIEAECDDLLNATEDLIRTDQKLLPAYAPIKTYIPEKLVGDCFMLREFMHSFASLLSGIEVFRGNLNFFEMSRAFTEHELAGPLSDIILILLGTIFDLQKEEAEECPIKYRKHNSYLLEREPFKSMTQATLAHFYSSRHFSFAINELPLNPLTLSEVIRLHFLSSGAPVEERTEKWRVMYRNGYSSSEDPGFVFRMRFPHILRALKDYPLYHLCFKDIMRIVQCLVAQILTYSSPINVLEERAEEQVKVRNELKTLLVLENRRVANIKIKKRTMIQEHNQQCAESKDEEEKKRLEEKLNRKVADLLAQSEREHRKYEQQVNKLKASLFNYLTYLGMDRAFRQYYVLESIPGIFIEHSSEYMGSCLENPPVNSLPTGVLQDPTKLPKNRKDLRAFLMKLYMDEEKSKKPATNGQKQTNGGENKENLIFNNGIKKVPEETVTNGEVNGSSNDAAAITVPAVVTNGENEDTKSLDKKKENPTQTELYMCSGDKSNCIVHSDRVQGRQCWSYIYKHQDIEDLIASLNPLGERESQLRSQLESLQALILDHVAKCPHDQLTVENPAKFKTSMFSDTSRKYNKANFGFQNGIDINDVMYSVVLEQILQFAYDIYSGDLGRIRVKDREKWCADLENGVYDPQCQLQWGTSAQGSSGAALTNGSASGDSAADASGETADDDDDHASDPYRDPGVDLGYPNEIDSEDSDDEVRSFHESPEIHKKVRNLASAVLQIEQSIERRFLKEPFGPAPRASKDKLERTLKLAANRIKQWEISLMESTSVSQVYLHLNVLRDCVTWSRSTSKSMCQVCHKGSDPDKMLLCDECNGGTHMFCMKPKMKTVPEGNWYCQRCVTRLGLKNQNDEKKSKLANRKRAFVVEEDDNRSELSETSSASLSKNRRVSGRRTSKRISTNDIEKALNEDNDEASDEDEDEQNEDEDNDEDEGENVEDEEASDDEDKEENDSDNEDDDDDDDDEKVVNGNQSNADSNENDSDQEDDENICSICSYDGGELVCTRCKDCFHLECIGLKRPPRYLFICTKCKSKEDTKRKQRNVDESSNDDDEEESEDEPLSKRYKSSRISLRSSQNGNTSNSRRDSQKNNSLTNSSNSTGRRSSRRTGDSLPLDSATLYKLLEEIMKNEHSWPFLRPVSQAEVPDYHKIIKYPMDFAKVKSKLNMGQYHLNEEVLNDIQLVFRNCDKYNRKGNEIYEAGFALERFVIKRCKELNLPYKPSDMHS